MIVFNEYGNIQDEQTKNVRELILGEIRNQVREDEMNEADFIAFKKVLGAVVTRLMRQGASPDEAARLAYSMFERDYPALMAGLAVYADQALQQVEGVGK